jgi:hypothetical protein
MTPKEASRRLPNGAIELTGAKDADGIPVELTSRDVERMGGEAAAEYKDRREKLIADRKAKAEDDDNLERWEGEGGGRDQTRRGGRIPGRSHLLQLVTSLTARVGPRTGGTSLGRGIRCPENVGEQGRRAHGRVLA